MGCEGYGFQPEAAHFCPEGYGFDREAAHFRPEGYGILPKGYLFGGEGYGGDAKGTVFPEGRIQTASVAASSSDAALAFIFPRLCR